MTERGFRNHIWYKLLDEEGVPIPSGSIWLYEYKNPVNQLVVYDVDGIELSQPLMTDENGVFDFFVKDYINADDTGGTGYTWDTQLIISWMKDDKNGIIRGDHIFGEFESVTLSGNLARMNKAISDYLGWSYNQHVDAKFGRVQGCGSSSSSSSSYSSSSSSSSSESSSSSSSSSSESSSSSSSSSSESSSSSSSSNSSSSSSSTSSYSSNCAEDTLEIPDGEQPDHQNWVVRDNDGSFGSGTGTTLGYDSSGYSNGQVYQTLYTSTWSFPYDSDWDIRIDWVCNYIESPNSEYNFLSFGYGTNDLSDWTRIQFCEGGSLRTYRIFSDPYNSVTSYTTTDLSGKFRIRKTGNSVYFYVWDAGQSRWEWNNNTSGYGTSYNAGTENAVVRLQFETGNSSNGYPTRYINAEMWNFQVTSYDEISCYSSSSSSTSSSSSSS